MKTILAPGAPWPSSAPSKNDVPLTNAAFDFIWRNPGCTTPEIRAALSAGLDSTKNAIGLLRRGKRIVSEHHMENSRWVARYSVRGSA